MYAEPELLNKNLTADDKYIIIASDGVWEFLTNQAVVNMVDSFKSPLKACKAVVQEAYKLWLQHRRTLNMAWPPLEGQGSHAQPSLNWTTARLTGC